MAGWSPYFKGKRHSFRHFKCLHCYGYVDCHPNRTTSDRLCISTKNPYTAMIKNVPWLYRILHWIVAGQSPDYRHPSAFAFAISIAGMNPTAVACAGKMTSRQYRCIASRHASRNHRALDHRHRIQYRRAEDRVWL